MSWFEREMIEQDVARQGVADLDIGRIQTIRRRSVDADTKEIVTRSHEVLAAYGISATGWTDRVLSVDEISTGARLEGQDARREVEALDGVEFGQYLVDRGHAALPLEYADDGDGTFTITLGLGSSALGACFMAEGDFSEDRTYRHPVTGGPIRQADEPELIQELEDEYDVVEQIDSETDLTLRFSLRILLNTNK